MKKIKKICFVTVAAAALGSVLPGCAVPRDAMTKEYQRLAAIKPTPKAIFCGDVQVDNLGRTSFSSYNFSVELMKNYVNATTNHREYIAFMNDVDYYVKEEKMNEKAAMEKVTKAIKDADSARSVNEKVWPRVNAGYQATMALAPEKMLVKISPVAVRVTETSSKVAQLKSSFSGLDQTTLLKAKACSDIIRECAVTSECLAFLTLQFQRTMAAKYYMK